MSSRFSKTQRLAMLAVLAAGVVGLGLYLLRSPAHASPTYPPMAWQSGQTVVSLEFDDATADQYLARQMLASHRMRATFYVNSGTVEASSFHMTWGQVHALGADGNEIAGHTIDHPNLLQVQGASRDEARRQVCEDRDNLLAEGFAVTDFAYPYGAFDSTTEQIARECGYDSARNVSGVASDGTCGGCALSETIPPGDPYGTRTPENVLARNSLATIEGYVTQAQRSGGGWVQLVFHHVCRDCGQPYAIAPADLSSLLDWLARQGVTVATVQQVIGGPLQPAVTAPVAHNLAGGNLLHDPSLEEGAGAAPACWDTNGWGRNSARWSRTAAAHGGSRAVQLDLTHYSDGGAMLLSHFDLGGCAPSITPGRRYAMSAWFTSTAPVLFYVYTRDARGRWSWWINSPPHPPARGYTQIRFTTPPARPGTTAISVGLGLGSAGSLTMDDYALAEAP